MYIIDISYIEPSKKLAFSSDFSAQETHFVGPLLTAEGDHALRRLRGVRRGKGQNLGASGVILAFHDFFK